MTETQAKSGTAGADTEPTRGSAQVSENPDTASPAAQTDSAQSSDSEASSNVIRRASGPAVQAPTDEASGPSRSEGKPATDTAVSESSPTTRLSVAEASARAAEVSRPTPAGRTGSAPAGSAASSASSSGSSSSAAPTSTGRLGTSAGRAGTVSTATTGRATVPVSPGTSTRGRTGVAPVAAARAATGAVTAAAAVGAARVSETLRTARATVAGAASRGPRRARLHLKRIDPWSVMKFSFAVSLVLFVVAIVATSVLYLALDAMNVFDSVNNAVAEITGTAASDTPGFQINAKGVIGTAVLLGAVNMVLFTALATLGAFVYNVCADLVGGIELTLSEKE